MRTWEDLGRINCGNTDVTTALCQVKGSLKPQTQAANATEMKTEATSSYSLCPQLHLILYFTEKELHFWPLYTQTMFHDDARDCQTVSSVALFTREANNIPKSIRIIDITV